MPFEMKRISLLLLLATALLTAGCTGGNGLLPDTDIPIVDWYPVNVILTVQDRYGNDLLDPSREGTFAHGTTLAYKGETFGVESILNTVPSAEEAPTKAYLARLYGLQLSYGKVRFSEEEERTCYYLKFGEIDGAKDLDEDLYIKWPDDSEDVIHYHCSDHIIKKTGADTWDISCDRSWKLNKKAASNPFKFVK